MVRTTCSRPKRLTLNPVAWLEIPRIAPSKSRKELPENVLKRIMDHADRTRDRKSWIYAVQFDKDLYKYAIQNYYRFFVLSRKNIVRHQEKPDTRIRSHGCDLTELLRSIAPLGNEPVAATFIESLLMNCQYGYKSRMDTDEAQLWRFILSLLEPHLVSLVMMQQYGPMEQPLWDGLLQNRRLHFLSIRQTDTHSLTEAFIQAQESAVLVGWERLVALGTLRHLDIGRLLTAEASSLALAVRQLPKLKFLRIEAASLATTLVHNTEVGYKGNHMPIARFLRFLFYKASMPPGFPISLIRLIIIDNGHKQIPGEYDFLRGGGLFPTPVLRHAYLDSADDHFGFRLISKITPGELTHLSISRMSSDEGPMHMYTLGVRLQALRSFTLLDCVANTDFLANWFVPRRRLPFAKYGLQIHVTLRTAMPPSEPKDRKYYYYSLRNVLFRQYSESPTAIYGTELRHICISNVTAERLYADDIDDPALGLMNLRIIVVRAPAAQDRGFWNVTLEHQPYRHGRLGLPLPSPGYRAVSWAEAEARALCTQKLRNLRFIVIHNHYYWVEQFDMGGYWTRLWRLPDALGDKWQRAKMKALIHEEDWAFLRNEAGIVNDLMSDEEFQRGNQLVIHRELGGFNDLGWEDDTNIGHPPFVQCITEEQSWKWKDGLCRHLKRKRDVDAEIEAGYFMEVPRRASAETTKPPRAAGIPWYL